MGRTAENRFESEVTILRDRRLPEPAVPAGYAALVAALDLAVPLPHRVHAIGRRHRIIEDQGWKLLTPRHAPEPSLAGHLVFALKREGLDLTILKALFRHVGPKPIEQLVLEQPTGGYARRLWFLYEWLTGSGLELPDAASGRYVDVLDASLQYGVSPQTSSRHRVRNNLPGSPAFCPLVRKTKTLEDMRARDLANAARAAVQRVPRDLIARAAAFLLLSDSKSSFAIENERPRAARVERWGQIIGQAGRGELGVDELLRLQRIVIGDDRFVRLGLRDEGGFVGERERDSGRPLPEHVSARSQDLPDLTSGLLDYGQAHATELDPVIAAACLAFGFVYIHPFEDGNGRIHRYLIHHVLAARRFNPPELVFPVSAVMLRELDTYRRVLESHSRSILPLIDWEPTGKSNVRVLNDTADFYRYFDATPHAEFLYHCVAETIERDLPHEARFLQAFGRFTDRVQNLVDMPAGTIDLLFRFLRQNDGILSARAREGEFSALTPDEVTAIEAAFRDELQDTSGAE